MSSSLPPGFTYLVLNTKSFPSSIFVIILYKYFGSKDPSALKIHDISVLELLNPCIIALRNLLLFDRLHHSQNFLLISLFEYHSLEQ